VSAEFAGEDPVVRRGIAGLAFPRYQLASRELVDGDRPAGCLGLALTNNSIHDRTGVLAVERCRPAGIDVVRQMRFLVLPVLPPALREGSLLGVLWEPCDEIGMTGGDALFLECFGHFGNQGLQNAEPRGLLLFLTGLLLVVNGQLLYFRPLDRLSIDSRYHIGPITLLTSENARNQQDAYRGAGKSVRTRVGPRKVAKGLSPRTYRYLPGRRRSGNSGRVRYLGRRLHAGLAQRAIDGHPHFCLGQGARNTLIVNK
jgi:hypothetical protein